MSDPRRPPLSAQNSFESRSRQGSRAASPYGGDPFADRPRQTQFQEPPRPYESVASLPQGYASTATLPQGNYVEDDYEEKVPLTAPQTYAARGAYPPVGGGYVVSR